MILSTTQLAEWRRCRQRYKWSRNDHLRPLRTVGRIRGDAGHVAFAEWYKTGNEKTAYEKAETVLRQEGMFKAGWSDNVMLKERRLLFASLARYFDWAERKDPWKPYIQKIEWRLERPIFKLFGEQHHYVAILDLVLRKPDGLYVIDHKFVKEAKHDHLLLDHQMTGNLLMAYFATGELPAGAIYNSVRLLPESKLEPARRTRVIRTRHGLQLAWTELIRQGKEAVRARHAWKQGKGEELVYRNTTTTCHWDCDFYQMCLAKEAFGTDHPELVAERPRQAVTLEGQ